MKTRFLTLSLLIALFSFKPPATFKWVKWKNVSAETKDALKKTKDQLSLTAYNRIIELLEEGCSIEVSVLDMDGDGKMEYAVASYGNFCCGNRGCGISVYSLGGKKQVGITDQIQDVRPSKYGVISSFNILFKFKNVK